MRGFVTEKRVIDCMCGMEVGGQTCDIVAVRWRPVQRQSIECDLVLAAGEQCVVVETKSHLRGADVSRLSRRFVQYEQEIMQDALIAGRATSCQVVCACETYSERAVALCQECGYGLLAVHDDAVGVWVVTLAEEDRS